MRLNTWIQQLRASFQQPSAPRQRNFKRLPRRNVVEALEERILPANDMLVAARDLGVDLNGQTVAGDFYGKGFFTWMIDTDRDTDFEMDRIFGVAGKTNPHRLVVGDWDGDGFDNLGAVEQGTSLKWFLDVDGEPDVESTIEFGRLGDQVVVGDWNKDGRSDLGVVRASGSTLTWIFGTLNETRSAVTVTTDTWQAAPGAIALTGDWNNDGYTDAAWVEKVNGKLVWHLRRCKNGKFDEPGTEYPAITFGPATATPVVGNWQSKPEHSPADNLAFVETSGTLAKWSWDENGIFTDGVNRNGVDNVPVQYGFPTDVFLTGNFRFSEVKVKLVGPEKEIFDRDLVTSTLNPVEDFGVVNFAANPELTFRVANTGNINLSLGNVSVPGGYELVEPLVGSLAPGTFDTFRVRLATNARGTYSGDIRFTTNDGNETDAFNQAFNFRVTGQVLAPVAQVTEAAVNGNRFDFGTVYQNFVLEKTFTLRNPGDADLVVPSNSVSIAGEFPVLRIEQPKAGTLKPGEFVTFKIVMDTREFTKDTLDRFQAKSGTVSVRTNDPLRTPLTFAITGGVDVVNSQYIGVFRGTRWYLDIDRDPAEELNIPYGLPGDVPVVGNWDGGDRDHIGVVRKHASGLLQWLLDLDEDPTHEIEFFYGLHTRKDGVPDDIPVVGDWNGDGKDDLGVVRLENGQYQWLLNLNDDKFAEETYVFGTASANTQLVMPVVGRWVANDRRDHFGVVTKKPGDDLYHWLLDTDTNRNSAVEKEVRYGLHSPSDHPNLGDLPVVGDWDGDGDSDLGTIHEVPNQVSVWYLGLNDSRSGVPVIDPHVESEIRYGLFGDKPVAGQWLPSRNRPVVEGFVWVDKNENGIKDASEVGQSNVTIYADHNHDGQFNRDSLGNPLEPSTTTNDKGFYRFAELLPGTSTIAISAPTGLVSVYPNRTAFTIGNAAVNYDEVADLSDQLKLELKKTATASTTYNGPPNSINQTGSSPKDLVNLSDLRDDGQFAGLDGSGTAIVVIDTGIDLNHPAFGPDTDGDGTADRIVFHQSFVSATDTAADTNGHGTHVTGIAAGGTAGFLGVAPKVNIIHLKVFPDQVVGASAQASETALEEALQWVIDHAADYQIVAVNLSLAAGNHASPSTDTPLSDEFEALRDLGIITVAAAGNAYVSGVQGVAYPATEPSVIAVGAVTAADAIASFSQRDDSQTDVYAPGASIRGPGLNGQAAVFSGTSQAAPFVAGAAVLMQQLAIEKLHRRLDFDEFVELLRNTGSVLHDPTIPGVAFRSLDVHELAKAVLDKVNANTHVVKLATSDQVGSINFGLQVQASSVPRTGSIQGVVSGLGGGTGAQIVLSQRGVELARINPDSNGRYSFAGLDLASVYDVHLVPQDGQEQVGPAKPAFVGVGTPTENTEANGVTVLDLDRDSRLDLAIVGKSADPLLPEQVELFRNTTNLAGGAPSFVRVGTLKLPDSFKNIQSIASFQRNGRTWLAVAAANLSNDQDRGAVVLFEQVESTDGAVKFDYRQALSEFPDGRIFKPSRLHVADLDHDGNQDLVVTDSRIIGTAARLGVVWNGSATLSIESLETVIGPPIRDITTADINRDGRVDLILTNTQNVILLQSANGNARSRTYLKAVTVGDVTGQIVNVAVGDFDGDLDQDIAIGRGQQSGIGLSNLSVLRNLLETGHLTFDTLNSQQAIGATGSGDQTPAMTTLTARDLNNDGKPDLAVTLLNVNKVFVLFNTTPKDSRSIFFQEALSFTPSLNVVGIRPSAVVVADLNGDGIALPEIVVANDHSEAVAGRTVGYFDVFQNTQVIGPQGVALSQGIPDQTNVNFTVGPLVNTAPDFLPNVSEPVGEHTSVIKLVTEVKAIDAESDRLTYSITGGTGQSYFTISSANGQVFVSDSALLDFETLAAEQNSQQPELTLVVQVRDTHGATATTTIAIRVTNVAEVVTVAEDAWPADGKLTVSVESGQLHVRDATRDVVEPRPVHQIDQLIVIGKDASANRLTLQLSEGQLPLPTGGLMFTAGDSSEDSIIISSNEAVATVETAVSRNSDGQTMLTWNQRPLTLSGVEHWMDQVTAATRRFVVRGELATDVSVSPVPGGESASQIHFQFFDDSAPVMPDLTTVAPTNFSGGPVAMSVTLGAGHDVADFTNLPAMSLMVSGGAGDDSLTGNLSNNRLEGEGGNDTLNGGRGNDTLVGSRGDDTYLFDAATNSETDTLTELPSEGTQDRLDFSRLPATVDVSVDLSSTKATQQIHLNRNLTFSAASIEHVIGGSGNDTLTGNASANRLEGRAGNDRLIGGLGNDALSGGLGDDLLEGKAGNDVYVFQTTTSPNEKDTVTETSSEGTGDRLDFSAVTVGVTVDLSLGTDQKIYADASRTLKLQANTLEHVTGSSGNDTLTGNKSANRLEGRAGNDRLIGGVGDDTLSGGFGDDLLEGKAGNDVYLFDVAATLETDTVIELANEGTGDQLDFSGLPADAPVTIRLIGNAPTTFASVHANRNLILNPETIETVIGGAGNDFITGNRFPNRLDGRGGNDTLRGGLGNDSLDGGLGANTVAEVAPTATKVDFVLTNTTLTGAGSDRLLNLQSANLTGSPSKDTFTVSGWTGTGRMIGSGDFGDTVIATKNSGFVLNNSSLQTSDGLLDLTLDGIGNANLTGGSGHDMFDVTGWTRTAKLTGGAGTNTLAITRDADFTLTTSSLISPTFGNLMLSQFTVARLTGGDADNTFNVSGWKGQGTLTGGGGLNTIVASRNVATFTLSDSRLTTTATDNLDLTLADIRVANLTGSSGNDTFIVSQWSGSGTIHGGTSGTSDRIVAIRDTDLTTLTNTALVSTGFGVLSLAEIEAAKLEGGSSDNKLVAAQFTLGPVTLLGGAGDDVLIGGSKKDSLDGGTNRDVLIGGLDSDTLIGGLDEDILIGGTSSHSGNLSALIAIIAEWKQSDLDYASRVSNLRDSGVSSGTIKLDSASVQNDANAADRLNGSAASPNNIDLDWFFQSAGDALDAINGEIKTTL